MRNIKNKKIKKDNRKLNEKIKLIVGIFIFVNLIGIVDAAVTVAGGGDTGGFSNSRVYYPSTNVQYSQSFFLTGSGYNVNDIWGDFNEENCDERQDFILTIPPGGCSPTVVRSDLLEEQDVPVFCKVASVQMNPLIDVSRINYITFKGSLPEGVKSFSYYPANAYVKSTVSLQGSPVVDNVGYLVIVLKRNPSEESMPEVIKGNALAEIHYNAQGTWGVGRQEFFSEALNDLEWERMYRQNGFWNGMFFLRVEDIQESTVRVGIYRDFNTRVSSVSLEKGKTSNRISLGGFYCSAGLQLQLQDITYPNEKAFIRVDDQEFWVIKGSKFLDNKCTVSDLVIGDKNNKKNNTFYGSIKVSCSGLKTFDLKISENKESVTNEEISGDIKTNFDESSEDYNRVNNEFPDEIELNSGDLDNFGAIALYELADLAGRLGQIETQKEYLEKLLSDYPESNKASLARQELDSVSYGSDSKAVFYINNEAHTISLYSLSRPSYENLNAEISVDGAIYKILSTETTINSNLKMKIEKLQGNVVVVNINGKSTGLKEGEEITIDIDPSTTKQNNVVFKLVKLDIEKEASIKIIPDTTGMISQANLSFGVGIEKRAIKLSPEKTKDLIEDLEHQIEQWNSVNDKLGEVVKTMKGTCFATSAVLTVKNFFSGLSGEAMARNKVMTETNGWNQKCENAVSQKSKITGCGDDFFTNIELCLLACNSEIEKSIAAYTKSIEDQNKNLLDIQNQLKTSGKCKDSGGTLVCEDNAVKDAYKNKYLSDDKISEIKVPVKGSDGKITYKTLTNEEVTSMDLDTMKKVSIYSSLSDGSVEKEVLTNDLSLEIASIQSAAKANAEIDILKQNGLGDIAVANVNPKNVQYQAMTTIDKTKAETYFGKDSMVTKVVAIPSDWLADEKGQVTSGKSIVVGLTKSSESCYTITSAKNIDKNDNSDYLTAVKNYYQNSKCIQEATLTSYKNKIVDDAKIVKYYPGGTVGYVPFQWNGGWYYVSSTPVTVGLSQPVLDSGKPNSYTIGYLGNDGIKSADDVSAMFYNGVSNKFPGLSESDSKSLVAKAESVLISAKSQYKTTGVTSVKIDGNTYKTGIASEGTKCSDFMSPADCQLMFNVCDPVLCPTSRCDFGGQYSVANVVQSGIIGSLMLCLPNAQEGILIPICLTGVHAGIESFVSILTSTRDCLNESLATGSNIGICDEIKSIYLCQFFWKQAVPLMDVFIPKLFELALGQGTRGGGEYLTVDYAWQNMQNSIDYFKNDYAVTAMKAFQMRSTAEVGDDVCNMYISTQYPTSSDFFENLIEPDSPVQFTGWFSEDVLTTATVPPMSHYKVYYHIYSGNDIGASYVVYLKEPKDTGLYYSSNYVIDRGYINKGSQVDQARDVEAISGYQKLCIEVNGKEECGFGQVSTDFAINYITDTYIAGQATQNISNTIECVSTTNGLIRVCATNNPSANTPSAINASSEYDRWKQVGTCDDKNVKCWIDTESVKDALAGNPGLTNSSLSEINANSIAKIISETGLWDANVSESKLQEADKLKDTNEDSAIELYKQVVDKAFNSLQKAKALIKLARIYGERTVKGYLENKNNVQQVAVDTTVAAPAATTITSTTSSIESVSLIKEGNGYKLNAKYTCTNIYFEVYESENTSVNNNDVKINDLNENQILSLSAGNYYVKAICKDSNKEYILYSDVLSIEISGATSINSTLSDITLVNPEDITPHADVGQDSCDKEHLDLCDEGDCILFIRGYWYDNHCHLVPKATICDTQDTLLGEKQYFCLEGEKTIFYVNKIPGDIKVDINNQIDFKVGNYGDSILFDQSLIDKGATIAQQKGVLEEYNMYSQLQGSALITDYDISPSYLIEFCDDDKDSICINGEKTNFELSESRTSIFYDKGILYPSRNVGSYKDDKIFFDTNLVTQYITDETDLEYVGILEGKSLPL
ncbi:MAG: hypothetical protein WC438_02370 [Candidatus Pacearchaeota archaeon]